MFSRSTLPRYLEHDIILPFLQEVMKLMEARRIILTQGESLCYVCTVALRIYLWDRGVDHWYPLSDASFATRRNGQITKSYPRMSNPYCFILMELMTAWLFIYEAEVLLVVHAKHNRAVDAEFQHSPCSEGLFAEF